MTIIQSVLFMWFKNLLCGPLNSWDCFDIPFTCFKVEFLDFFSKIKIVLKLQECP